MAWYHRLRNLARPGRIEKEIEQEFSFHIQERADELKGSGMSEEEAGLTARRRFGNYRFQRERTRDMDILRWLESTLMDARYAFRGLMKTPGFALVAILTLALGIGANTAVFSILNAVLLEKLPYNDADRLYMLRSMDENGAPTGLMAERFAQPLYEGNEYVEAAAISFGVASSIIAADNTAYPFLPYFATRRFFDVFDGQIALGRAFEPDEPDESIVISYSTWRDQFGLDPDILGRIVTVIGSPQEVIGVTRESFEFPRGAQSWQPLTMGPELEDIINFEGYLKMQPGVSPDAFRAELAALSDVLGPNRETGQPLDYALVPLLDEVVGNLESTLYVLSGATFILLLIACLNIANLLFARARTRSHEIGLREAIGAGRARIVRQLLTESVILSTLGGVIGIAVAFAGVRVLLGLGPSDLPRLDAVGIDLSVLVFSAGTILLTSLLMGLAPAVSSSRTQISSLIALGGRGGSGGRADRRVFGGLVVAEVALAVVLVIGAGLVLRSYAALTASDPGFDSDGILAVRLMTLLNPDVETSVGDDGQAVYTGSGYQPISDFYDELVQRIRGLAGVTEVAHAQELPLHPNPAQASTEPFTIFGRPDVEEQQVRIRPVSANFFATLGGRILAGRDFEPSDRRGSPGIGIVNEAFVLRYFPREDPVGQRLELPATDFRMNNRGYGFAERIYDSIEIVGVVSDMQFTSRFQDARPTLFMSTHQFTTRMRNIAVQTELDDPQGLVPAIRREVAEMAPTVPVEFYVYPEIVDRSIARERLGMALFAVFASLALVLAAVGIYGTMAYTVNQRRREIAVRTALGASSFEVLGSVVRQGMVLGLAGVLLGVAVAVAFRQVIAGQLYGISAVDPTVLVVVPIVLLGVSLAASLVPARRASKIDPMVALRQE